MRSNRSQQSSSISSKVTQNFQLQKPHPNNTRPNPQQQQPDTPHSPHTNSHRYDIIIQPQIKQQYQYQYQYRRSERDRSQKDRDRSQRDSQREKEKVKSNSYRVRKSYGGSSRSQNGGTVYQVVNLRRNNVVRDTEEEYTLTSKSQVIGNNSHFRSHVLQNDKKLTQPQSVHSNQHLPNPTIPPYNPTSTSTFPSKPQPLFLQNPWPITQPHPSCQPTSIHTQKPQQKQSPLNPSKPQLLSELLRKQAQVFLEKIPEEQYQENGIENGGGRDGGRGGRGRGVVYGGDLVGKLGMRTRYWRFRHSEKIREKMGDNSEKVGYLGYNNLYQPKSPNKSKPTNITLTPPTTKIQTLIKLLHNPNHPPNPLKITIKIPPHFHNVPDILLPEQQLKFKAIMIFEEFGVMRSGIVGEGLDRGVGGVRVVRCRESLTFIYEGLGEDGDREKEREKGRERYGDGLKGRYCVSWYEDGSVYMGQMRDDVRQGVGLEWVPGVYVYYGQYLDNLRHGYGVMKYNNTEVYIGVWSYDSYHGYGKLIDGEGMVIEQGVFRNSEIIRSAFFNQLS